MGRFLTLIIVIGALVWWFSRNPGTSPTTQDQAVASNPGPTIHGIGRRVLNRLLTVGAETGRTTALTLSGRSLWPMVDAVESPVPPACDGSAMRRAVGLKPAALCPFAILPPNRCFVKR
jgi:hypothetical protein